MTKKQTKTRLKRGLSSRHVALIHLPNSNSGADKQKVMWQQPSPATDTFHTENTVGLLPPAASGAAPSYMWPPRRLDSLQKQQQEKKKGQAFHLLLIPLSMAICSYFTTLKIKVDHTMRGSNQQVTLKSRAAGTDTSDRVRRGLTRRAVPPLITRGRSVGVTRGGSASAQTSTTGLTSSGFCWRVQVFRLAQLHGSVTSQRRAGLVSQWRGRS